jgi:hypothetical protein
VPYFTDKATTCPQEIHGQKKPQSGSGMPHPTTLEPVLYTLPNLGDYQQHVIHDFTEIA